VIGLVPFRNVMFLGEQIDIDRTKDENTNQE
jgi:hypothetical protein